MSRPNGSIYKVVISKKLAQWVEHLHEQVKNAGLGEQFVTALAAIYERLKKDPEEFGEPLYRLPALRLGVRTGAVFPLGVDYAVHEEKPVVFLKAVRLIAWT